MQELTDEEQDELVQQAREARQNAIIFGNTKKMGAALLTDDGDIYQGCNIQSVISGMGTCAERSVINHAVAHGEHCFRAVAVAGDLENPPDPCGMCLQYMTEFAEIADHDIIIVMAGRDGIATSSVRERLPHTYSLSQSAKEFDGEPC